MEHQLSTPREQRNYLQPSIKATIAVFVTTTFHHLYGADLYNTPWRRHVIINGGIALLICLAFLFLYKRYKTRIFLIIYLLVSFIFFGLVIGIFEGLYNHVLKDILFFSGMPFETWRHFFPAPTYETPNDLIFESTGVIQFFVAVIMISLLVKAYRFSNNVIAS